MDWQRCCPIPLMPDLPRSQIKCAAVRCCPVTLIRCGDRAMACQAFSSLMALWIGEALRMRSVALVALSGGSTPRVGFELLALQEVDWSRVHVLLADDRIVPLDHIDSNWRTLRSALLDKIDIPEANLHPYPTHKVDQAGWHTHFLNGFAGGNLGKHLKLDVAHLGLGNDGHTASLLPGDTDTLLSTSDFALTRAYKSHRRVTMTVPTLRRARRVIWFVTGGSKAVAVQKLATRDESIPASAVDAAACVILGDRDALRLC